MSLLQIILLVIIILIALFFITALMVKKECVIAKEVIIDKPKQVVFDYVKLIRNQEKYSVWVMKDPNIKIVYTGTDGTIGFVSSWESEDKNVGIGAQEIIKMEEGENIEMELRFKTPFEATNYARTTLVSMGDTQTKLINVFSGKSKFPMNIMNLFMEKMVGADMQKNLTNLKNILES